MGNCGCGSVHKNTDQAAKLKVQFDSPTPSTENASVLGYHSVAEHCSRPDHLPPTEYEGSSRDLIFSEKPEMFFDPQPWLESDCEDFFSVNSDPTPPLGNSPANQGRCTEYYTHSKTPCTDSEQNTSHKHSPSDTSKQPSELLCESSSDNPKNGARISQKYSEEKLAMSKVSSATASGTLYESVPNCAISSELPPCKGYLSEKKMPNQSVRCCVPSFIGSLGCGRRKKKLCPLNQ